MQALTDVDRRVRSSDLVRRLRRHEAGTHLIRRFRRAEALTIEPRPIKAANASLTGSEHFAGIVDPTRASLSTGLFSRHEVLRSV
jgi:hypothetical protein